MFAYFFDHLAQTPFEFSPVHSARNQKRQIERHNASILQHGRHTAFENAFCQPFHNGCFSHSRLAEQEGIVFRASAENFHHTLNLGFATDHRVNRLLNVRGRKVAPKVIEGRSAFRFLGLTRSFDGLRLA